eukprot:COSAG01_NODE_50057_length_366_cov_3.805243_2_plen_58_part_01
MEGSLAALAARGAAAALGGDMDLVMSGGGLGGGDGAGWADGPRSLPSATNQGMLLELR